MNPPTSCPHCHHPIGLEDNFCSYCGRNLHPGHGFFYSHTGIILLTLLLGPFAFPWVWMSKRIGPGAKIFYGCCMLIMGIFLFLAFQTIFQLTQATTQLLLGGF